MGIDRRTLLRWTALSGAVAGLGAPRLGAEAPANGGRPARIKPRRLREGDRVGMILPASMAFEASEIDRARQQLEAIGFEVVVGAHARERFGTFAGTDEQRVADLHAMFADPEIAGIICYTGGWGTPRLLPLLDEELIRSHPKVLLGFSDVTALLNAVTQRTGLVTFHGPVARSRIDPWSLEQLRRVLFSAEPIGELTNPPRKQDDLVDFDYRLLTIRGGRARGRLVGGNLTMLASLMGTPWEVDTEGAILLLEDVHEANYRIDRMLTQLKLGGKLDRVAGIVFGYCSQCPAEAPSFSLEEILELDLGSLGVPVLAGLAFGHLAKKLTLPLGLEATLDVEAGTLTLDEAAVV